MVERLVSIARSGFAKIAVNYSVQPLQSSINDVLYKREENKNQ